MDVTHLWSSVLRKLWAEKIQKMPSRTALEKHNLSKKDDLKLFVSVSSLRLVDTTT